MAQSTYASLLESLRHDDTRCFRATLEKETLPRGAQWLDYELLIKALKLNRKRMVTYLLDKGCRVVKPGCPNTPLHIAVGKLGYCKIVEKMLSLGGRVTDVNSDGDTVLHVAFKSKHTTDYIIDLLLKRYLAETTVDVFDRDGLGFMHIACTRPKIDIVKEFFDTGKADMYGLVSFDSTSKYAGYSPLHFAVEFGRHDMAKFLCEYEADIYQQNSRLSTPMHLALENRDTRMIDIILYHDSRNENYINNAGLTHFMAACAVGDASLIEEYLHVANERHSGTSLRGIINSRVNDLAGYEFAGYTPLHFAAEFGHSEIVKGLLQIGANCDALTSNGLTPYALADKYQHQHVLWVFQQWFEFTQIHNLMAPQHIKYPVPASGTAR